MYIYIYRGLDCMKLITAEVGGLFRFSRQRLSAGKASQV